MSFPEVFTTVLFGVVSLALIGAALYVATLVILLLVLGVSKVVEWVRGRLGA